MNLNELSNKELLFVYFSNKSLYDVYETVFSTKKYESVVDMFDMGSIIIKNTLFDEEITEMQNSEHYIYVANLNEKLEPIATIIGEVDPKLYDEVEEAVNMRYRF
jgi:hypothetical protein